MYDSSWVSFFAGHFVSELHVHFVFQRYLMSVFFQSYFLAMSMVVLAGLGTWLDPMSVPGRVAVGTVKKKRIRCSLQSKMSRSCKLHRCLIDMII